MKGQLWRLARLGEMITGDACIFFAIRGEKVEEESGMGHPFETAQFSGSPLSADGGTYLLTYIEAILMIPRWRVVYTKANSN